MQASCKIRMKLVAVDISASVRRSALVVWIIINLGLDNLESEKPVLNMLFIIPANTTGAIANRTACSANVAINVLNKSKELDNFTLDWNYQDNICSPKKTVEILRNIWNVNKNKTDVIFGGYCENVCNLLAIISNAMNMPCFVVDCVAMDSRTQLYVPNFLTMDYRRSSAIPLLVALMKSFNWKTIAILASSEITDYDLAVKIKNGLEDNDGTAIIFLTTINKLREGLASTAADDEIDVLLDDIRGKARIIFLALDSLYAARFLLKAHEKEMYNGEFAFIGYDLTTPDSASIGTTAMEWEAAKVGLIYFRPIDLSSSIENGQLVELSNMQVAVYHKPYDSLRRLRLFPDDKINVRRAADIFVALRIYFYLCNYHLNNMTAEAQRDSGNATEMFIKNPLPMRGLHDLYVATKNGVGIKDVSAETLKMLRFDEKGFRIPEWHVMNSGHPVDKVMFHYENVGEDVEKEFLEKDFVWPGNAAKAPADDPECGWDDEKCLDEQKRILIWTCAALGALVFVGIIIAIFVSRWMKAKGERKTLTEWRVKWSQVVVIGDNVIGRISAHDTGKSRTSVETESRAGNSSKRSDPKSLLGRLYTFTGTYKGKTVAIKKINRDSIDILQPTFYNELKQLFYISHVNVNPFIGVCSEAPNVCVLMLYAERGSLQDILAEPKYDINWEFRICLTTDVAKGMAYLHESPIGSHGHLTSSNCVVDRKWECRITDYGLKQFKRSKNQEISTFRWNSDLLWTAPEILKKPETDRDRIYGTKEGDVYSFGIIVYEVLTKELPYHTQLESITPEDVVFTVKKDPEFRPTLPKPENSVGAGWNSLATICWHEKPEVRPSFATIQGKLKSINDGKIPNLMDRMQHMMEDAVQQKSTEIASEKKRTETVVYNLLPQSIAKQIIDGKEIRPQRFDRVTLCYCETTDIFSTAKTLSPIQVTEILTLLFHSYDDVMKKFNITEIGGRGSKDSLILASGLPDYTKKHAENICEMSLDLISGALAFKTPLAPTLSLNMKICIHSGPVLAAVVWRTLPRYCVSGEAVDTILSMQDASKEMRIRISDATYKHISRSGSLTVEQGGKVTIKDGKPIKTYWLTGKNEYQNPLPKSIKRKSSSLKDQKKEGKKSK